MRLSRTTYSNIAKTIAVIAAFWMLWFFVFSQLDKPAIQDFVSQFGAYGPISLTLLLAAISLIPFYNGPLLLASGFLYGPIGGFIITFVGQLIGQIAVILLVKRYGRPFAERTIPSHYLKKYEHWENKYGLWTLYFVYVLPGFPDDAFTYLLALSHRPFIAYLPALIFGGLGKATISFIGHDPVGGLWPLIIIRAVMLTLGLAAFAYVFWLRPK